MDGPVRDIRRRGAHLISRRTSTILASYRNQLQQKEKNNIVI